MSKPNILVRFFASLWRGIDGVRKVLHLLLLLLIFSVFLGAMFGSTPPLLPQSAALQIRPAGFLVEQYAGDPFDRATQELLGEAPPQTVVDDIVKALRHAKTDDRIIAVHLELSALMGGGLSKLQRVGDAIVDFRESGKPVIASADFYSQGGYYLAAHADETYLHPEGVVMLTGYGSFRTYYKEVIDTLRIDWNIFRVGTYKSYVEPYTRMDMSDEARESLLSLTDQLWEMYRAGVVNIRGLEVGAIAGYADNFLERVAESDGDMAAAALAGGLIDGLRTRKELREMLIEIVGQDSKFEDAPRSTDMGDYLAQMNLLDGKDVRDENIAIVVASGDITFGSKSPGTIGADSTSKLLRRAFNDETVRAVVLRVDSPGGSAFASEVIANEIAALQAEGKPVVASMSSTAASGGYWIAAGADKIFASPATITGSIGIFGMFPTYNRSLEALGIGVDGVGSTIWAGELRPDREMSPHAKALFQLSIEEGYDDFISRVAVHRGMEKEDVDLIGQGRVWTGVDALENGLVDSLGSLDDAIAAAAELAELDEGSYGTKSIRTELSPTEQFVLDLMSVAKNVGVEVSAFSPRPSALSRIAGKVERLLTPLLQFDDPKGVYAHCLCNFE